MKKFMFANKKNQMQFNVSAPSQGEAWLMFLDAVNPEFIDEWQSPVELPPGN